MNIDHRANRCKIKKPAGIAGLQVDAAMAHRCPEIMMPVGAMQPIILVEVHHVRYSWQVIPRSRHRRGAVLDIDFESPFDRWVIPCAG